MGHDDLSTNAYDTGVKVLTTRSTTSCGAQTSTPRPVGPLPPCQYYIPPQAKDRVVVTPFVDALSVNVQSLRRVVPSEGPSEATPRVERHAPKGRDRAQHGRELRLLVNRRPKRPASLLRAVVKTLPLHGGPRRAATSKAADRPPEGRATGRGILIRFIRRMLL